MNQTLRRDGTVGRIKGTLSGPYNQTFLDTARDIVIDRRLSMKMLRVLCQENVRLYICLLRLQLKYNIIIGREKSFEKIVTS